jgi:hypothetical protein
VTALLVDIGSTVVKLCRWDGAFGPVEAVPRDPAAAPGEQVVALAADRPHERLRVCSSANGGLRVGVLGLSARSVSAAARAAIAAGGNVRYQREFGVGGPAVHVDVLVLAGGVDGADLVHLRRRIPEADVSAHPHDVLVWAGAHAPDVVAGLGAGHVVPNVLDRRLRPFPAGLAELVRTLYVGDLVDHKGLRALAGRTETPIWPTPAVVALGVDRWGARRALPSPFAVVDVGGATTDVLYSAELYAGDPAPTESVVREVCPDLGVAVSLPSLRERLTVDPGLLELTSAVAPDRARELYTAISEGSGLDRPTAFLACLYLALRRVDAHLDRAVAVAVTGGAWTGAGEADVRRVVAAATGGAGPHVHLDRDYHLWAHGLLAVPA